MYPLRRQCLLALLPKWGCRNVSHQRGQRDYQFLDVSPVPTDKFAASLPRLPIPRLRDTLDRYLASQRPLLTDDQLRSTAALADEFERGAGRELQRELVRWQRQNPEDSFAAHAHKMEMLRNRDPLVLNSNSGGRMPTREDQLSPEKRAASILISSLRFFKSLRANTLNPPVIANGRLAPLIDSRCAHIPDVWATQLARPLFGVCPTDVTTFKHLFQSARIPMLGRDEFAWHPSARHVVVMRKGRFYSFEALDCDWNLFHPAYYLEVMERIARYEPRACNLPCGIAALTTEDRDNWAVLRKHLSSLGQNAQILHEIESALLLICFDDDWKTEKTKEDDLYTLEHVTRGFDPANRWCDKSINWLIGRDGQAGLHYEHSWGDGHAVLYFLDRILADLQQWQDFSPNEGRVEDGNFRHLEFILDACVSDAIGLAKNKFEHAIKEFGCHQCQIEGFGNILCKSAHVSTDFMMQIAFQLAFYKIMGTFASTYESCSTATYLHGRIEGIRPLTLDSKRFIDHFCRMCILTSQVRDDRAELMALLRKASLKHQKIVREALNGQAWDMHVDFLYYLCLESNAELPLFFQDNAFVSMQEDLICSSTVPAKYCRYGLNFPTSDEGYAFFYNISKEEALVNIASKKHCGEMANCLQETFLELSRLMLAR